MNTAVVILAAGASSRLGEPKALADLNGRSALKRLIDSAHTGAGGPIHVVVGRHAHEIRSALESTERVTWVDCPNWEEGRMASLAAGINSAGPGRAIMVAPVDVPLVSAETFRTLTDAWHTAGAPPSGWLAPSIQTEHGLRYGHPIVIGRELASKAITHPTHLPLRALRAHADPLASVPVSDVAVLDDLDTPADVATLCSRLTGLPEC